MQPNLLSIRKKILLSGVSSEYKDLAKFAEDTDSHLRHSSLQARNPKTNYPHPSAKRKFHGIPKTDRPTKRPMAGHKGTTQYNSASTWEELKKQSSRRSQCKNYHKQTLKQTLRQDFEIVAKWFYKNYMVLNSGKCHLCVSDRIQ